MGNIFNHLQIQPGELEQAKGACNFPQAGVHTHQLVTIIDGLECNNLSDLISSYDYEKFVILQDFNLDGKQIPARCKALNLLPLTPSTPCSALQVPTPNIEETASSSCWSQFLV